MKSGSDPRVLLRTKYAWKANLVAKQLSHLSGFVMLVERNDDRDWYQVIPQASDLSVETLKALRQISGGIRDLIPSMSDSQIHRICPVMNVAVDMIR